MGQTVATSRLRGWLELCRISNLPTVWTNVLVGSAVAQDFGVVVLDENGERIHTFFKWPAFGLMALALSLFYIGGMALNDLADADIDQLERPGRPIPSGRISRPMALNFVIVCFLNGLVLIWLIKPDAMVFAVLLLIAIFAYDFLHKRFAASVLLMGACRSLVVLCAAAGSDDLSFDHIALPVALALGVYVVFISIIARGETGDRIDGRKWLALMMPVMVLAMFAVVRPADLRGPAVAGFVLSLWLAQPVKDVMARPPRTIRAVMAWLSGICLVDAYFLTLLNAPLLAAVAGGCFVLTAWGHRKIVGT